MMNAELKKKIESRLKRVDWQASGIQRMVDENRYCVDVFMQNSAARAALATISKMLFESHIQTCVSGAFENDDDRAAKIAELIRIFEKNCS